MDIKIRNRTDEEMQLRKKELFELTDLLNQKNISFFMGWSFTWNQKRWEIT